MTEIKDNLEEKVKNEPLNYLKILAPIYGEIYHWKNTKGKPFGWRIFEVGTFTIGKYWAEIGVAVGIYTGISKLVN